MCDCRALSFDLPAPLYDFYTRGSASCHCHYWWSSDSRPTPWEDAFPSQYTLYGGPEIIPASQLAECCANVRSWASSDWTGEGGGAPPGFERWRHAIPFVAVNNGDYLALDANADTSRTPVLYLCHEADVYCSESPSPATEISPSFEQFLADWEKLCYVGPEIWLLSAFLAEDFTGPLQTDSPRASRWRDILLNTRA